MSRWERASSADSFAILATQRSSNVSDMVGKPWQHGVERAYDEVEVRLNLEECVEAAAGRRGVGGGGRGPGEGDRAASCAAGAAQVVA